MAALRCSHCATNWPVNYNDYQPCPECLGPVCWMPTPSPIDRSEARSRKNHADFERYYERREADRAEAAINHEQLATIPEERKGIE